MSVTEPEPTIDDVEAAARRIGRSTSRTPLVRSVWLSELSHADVSLKLETVQTTGSFKLRGATNALARLKETRPQTATVVTASAGNHGLAVAWAAAQLGFTARVYLPATAPVNKRQALAKLGATILETPTYDEAEARAQEEGEQTDAVYVSPYNNPDVIAGAGTVALEMLTDRPDLDTIVVPLGGGGLLSGTAIVARSRRAGMLVIGAEAAASPVFTSALAVGRVVPLIVRPTLADGLAGNMEQRSRTFGIVRDLVDRVVTIDESSIEAAMRGLILQERLVAEGAGAAAVAAILRGDLHLAGRRIGAILSGRNVDADVIRGLLGHS